MLKNANFLCEIGTEEIPAGYLPPAIQSIETMLRQKFEEHRIDFDMVKVMATPRRLVAAVSGVAATQRDEEVEVKGPSAKAAYGADGAPSKALEGFLRGNGLELSNVYTVTTDKGDYIYGKKRAAAGKTEEIIPSIVEHIVGALPFPKRMKWSDKTITFPRPVAYFLILFNDVLVPFEMSGIASSNMTRGHFIQSNRMVEVPSIAEYLTILEDNNVIVDQDRRKELIRKELQNAADSISGTIIEDEELLDTVTFLVEKPHIVVCGFDKEFLAVPDIVLITEMKEHQKYFALRDKAGKLMPNFLVVSNNPPTDHIRAGNERVIRARFNDGRFFFEEDRKIPLSGFVDSLKNVLFHKDLGSIYDKVLRMQEIAAVIVKEMSLPDDTAKKIQRAIELSKADLNTAMVFEFTSLQGQIGRIYALLDGEDPEVADALEEHYRPRSHEDAPPEKTVSVVVSLAEKIDNILGSWSVGNIPKGSQDPYALRRQANAVVDMLIARDIDLDIDRVLDNVAEKYKDGKDLLPKILEFINARAKTIFSDRGFRYDETDACLSIGYYNYNELVKRARSLNEFRKKEQFSQMLLSFKRMNNICSAFRKKNEAYQLAFSPELLVDPAEKKLHEFFSSRKKDIDRLISENRYIELFELLIGGKGDIDNFFDEVMVMAEDVKVRDNRLALLESILEPFTNLLDFSRISE
ncbi:MAG TPA: glycine--tRNA ligase subunit beta [Spirochaetota bacterium]|nr:glycine--tRNA ligase subunit beta [Spirochaetota bacterium]